MAVLIHSDLSYKVMGILYEVHNKLGSSRQEKHYQRALELELVDCGLPFEREKKIVLDYKGKKIGDYFLDFVIDGKIVLELKAKDFYTSKDINQVISYLKTLNLHLGILVNFRSDRLKYRRVINPDLKDLTNVTNSF
ncbi:MAG: GxxExxY protein [Candidatus Curtissbacteria bacterium]